MSTPEQKFKRFLHYGSEIPVYQPGMRDNNDAYSPTELQSLGALIANEKFSEAPACIVKAFSDGYSAHPEMLVYALALCVKQKIEPLSAATHRAIKTVCVTPENLFLFIKYATKLNPDGTIFTSGLIKVISEWYLHKDAKTLAEIVSLRKKYHGWSHKDIMKLIHLKCDNPVMSAVIKYVLYGINNAKKEIHDEQTKQATAEVLNYLQLIEDFRQLKDEQQAARMLESHNLTIEHVPCHLFKSKEIWSALIGNLPLKILINSLQRIGYRGFLKPTSPLVAKVLDALHDERLIAESHLHPAQVFIALKKYELSSKFVASEKAQKRRRTESGRTEERKVSRAPPKPNTKIIQAMNELFLSTSKLFLAPTGLRYLVAINMRPFTCLQSIERCYRCQQASPAEAVVVTTLCLLNAEQNVSVRGHCRHELVELPLVPNMTVQGGVDTLNEALRSNNALGRLTISKVLTWVTKHKEEYDVILYITEFISKFDVEVPHHLEMYRAEVNLPNAKLITLSLTPRAEPSIALTADDPGIFDIMGFDGNVPRIIEAFSRGAF